MLLIRLLSRLHCIAQLVVLVGLLHCAIHLHDMLVPLLQCGAQLTLATLLLTATVLTSDGHFFILYIGSEKSDCGCVGRVRVETTFQAASAAAAAAMPNCKHCINILIDYQIKHSEGACPLRASFHCAHCHAHVGHTTGTCPKAPPDYVYAGSIQGLIRRVQRARASAAVATEDDCLQTDKLSVYSPAKEILDNEKVLREFVRARIGIPAVKAEENKKRIREWAKAVGTDVRYIPDEGAVAIDNFAEYDRIYAELNPKAIDSQAEVKA
jgi:hypothetical protein